MPGMEGMEDCDMMRQAPVKPAAKECCAKFTCLKCFSVPLAVAATPEIIRYAMPDEPAVMVSDRYLSSVSAAPERPPKSSV